MYALPSSELIFMFATSRQSASQASDWLKSSKPEGDKSSCKQASHREISDRKSSMPSIRSLDLRDEDKISSLTSSKSSIRRLLVGGEKSSLSLGVLVMIPQSFVW
uniref:Uncharacterized protein n=1 Tax=Opuntia streptacantha TaxID=393608 RepID=A0A7C9CXD4_OPUST